MFIIWMDLKYQDIETEAIMAIKQKSALTKEDFEAAIVTLRLSVSEVSRESGIPRHIVSHFRNYGDGMKPEQLAKLRDYFESQGVEFDETEETFAHEAHGTGVDSLSPHLSVGLKIEHFFPISNTIADEVVRDSMSMMEENDARLSVLLKTKAERESGFFGDGELTEDTQAALQETFALLANNYLIFRMLRGWRALNQPPADENFKTVRDMLMETFKQPLIEAGLIESDIALTKIDEEVKA